MSKQQHLNQEISKLQNLLQNEKNTKIVQEKEFQAALDKFKDFPKLSEFKLEALEVNKLLSQQLNEFCTKLTQAEPFCDITSSLIQDMITLRQEIDDANERISEFLTW